jgi:hypothetical protein
MFAIFSCNSDHMGQESFKMEQKDSPIQRPILKLHFFVVDIKQAVVELKTVQVK